MGPPLKLKWRSTRSMRAARPRSVSSVDGNNRRAHRSSRCRRGLVAPVISVSAALVMSPQRDSSAGPRPEAWVAIRWIWSSGTPCRTSEAFSGTARTRMRSRKRSRRSSTKRRGSWPDWITRSTAANTEAESCAANASTTSSSSSPWVKPNSATARSYEIPSSPEPAMSWSRTESVSRAEPPPARTTRGTTPGAIATCSTSARCCTYSVMGSGGMSRKG